MKRLFLLLLAVLPLVALAQPKNPKLAVLQVEIWPEYDRPAALIILNGELAPDAPLPASITLRLPGASGGVHAVASASRQDAPLINVEHTQKSAGDSILVSFELASRFFHVEYYDPLATQARERSYTFLWPADFAAQRAMVMLQEPAGASDISMQPEATNAATGQNGLRYRSAELGAIEAGKPVKVEVRYAKADARTTAEILQADKPAGKAAPGAAASSQPPAWVYGVVAALAVIVAALAFIVWYDRRSRPAPPPAAAIPPAAPKGKKKRRAK